MDDDSVKIHLQLTKEDYAKTSADIALAADQNDSNYVSSRRKIIRFLIIGSAVLAIGLIAEIYFKGWNGWRYYVEHMSGHYSIYIAAVLLLTIPLMVNQYNKNLYQRCYDCTLNTFKSGESKSYLAPITYVFSKEIILSNSEYCESRVKWACIERVTIQGGDLCLFLSSASALFIPQRFFSSHEEKLAVYHKCKRWFEAAQVDSV